MLIHLGQNLLAIACGFGAVAVIGSILHQESLGAPKQVPPKPLSLKPRQTVATAQVAAPRPIQLQPENPKPVISQVPQPQATSPGENTEQPKRKTPEERAAMRAMRAQKLAKREERMRKKAQREQQQSV